MARKLSLHPFEKTPAVYARDALRKNLEKLDGVRGEFTATFVRFGSRTNYKGYSEETILLKDVRSTESNSIVTDHLWFSYTKGFQSIALTPGAMIIFDARIKKYLKGYVNKRIAVDQRKEDYKLSHPTRIRSLTSNR